MRTGHPAVASALAAVALLNVSACFAAGADATAAPRASLIVNGDFRALDEKGRPTGWLLPETGVSVVSDGDLRTLSLKTTSTGSTSATQELALDPAWGVLRFSYQVRVKAITVGKVSWNDARIALTVLGPADKVSHMVAGNWDKPTDGWIDVAQNVTIPTGAEKVKISPAIFDTVGEWELRNLRVELAAKRGEGIDSDPPAGQSVTWGEEPVEAQGARRAVMCLNGLWRFQPALGPAVEAPQKTGWGWIRVPGSWRPCALPGVTAATGPSWEGFNGETPATWYERDLTIPAAWTGRAILLDLLRVSTDAAVFIDNREIGRVSWPGGEVDLTAAVEPGKTHHLRLKVVATADAAEVTRFMGMGEGQILKEKTQLVTRGLIGNVLLTSRPAGAHLAGCAIRTSVREHKLTLDVDYDGMAAAGTVALNAAVRDAKGAEAKRFSADVAAVAGAGTLTATWDWSDPLLWDIDAPNLYTLELSAQGPGLDDALVERFGFREFRIDGKRFMLNEKEIRLRPTHTNAEGLVNGNLELIRSFYTGLHANGFNCNELWPWNRNDRGMSEYDDLWCAEADRLGFLVICPAMCMTRLVGEWDKPGVKAEWQDRMVRGVKGLRNHPSVIIWATGANRFGHGQDQNPDVIGSKKRAWIEDPSWRRTAAFGEDAVAAIKQVDPTRPVLMHAGSAVGDVYTANNYLCVTALQEREEWPSRWVADGDMPLLMVEFGTPLYTTFHRGRQGYGHASSSEPLYSEFCAIYEGADAYRAETAAYRKLLAATFQKDQLWSTWHNIDAEQLHPGYQQLQALFIRNTWRAWRTWGVTGGTVPWSNMGWQKDSGPAAVAVGLKPRPPVDMPAFEPGLRGTWHPSREAAIARFLRPEGMIPSPVSEALSASNQETLAWVAGAPDFVDKTHHYRVGGKVAKQFALLNDSRAPLHFNGTWRVEIDGVPVADGRLEGEITAATTKLVPVEFALPATIAADSVKGAIHLECSIGAATHADNFAFRVFRPAAGALPAVNLLDPQGDTGALLKRLGVSAKPWDGIATDRLLVVGRNALAKGSADLAAIEKCLGTGTPVLLMAQDPDWMREHLGLRVAWQLTRRGFPTVPDHPALGGLDADALRDWAGSSNLISPVDTSVADAHPYRCPPHGWRWGARHAISSAAIEVPHRAGWRPLIACEFDSAYTPLAEVAIGSGIVTLCTLDLEDHAAEDPAAERLARSVLAAAAAAKPEPRAPAAYLGGPDGAALLATSGVLHQKVDTLPETGLAVIGADATVDDSALDAFLRRGGKAIVLPRRAETAPLGVHLSKVEQHPGSLSIPTWSSCHGLLPGELHRRTDGEAWIIASGADEVGADGLLAEIRRGDGVAVFFQLDAAALDADHVSYNRLTRWRWTRALTQIAANLGAECECDRRLLKLIPPPDRIALAGTWKAALTISIPLVGANDPKPKDAGPSDRARSLVAKDADDQALQDVLVSKDWQTYGAAWNVNGEAVFRRTVDVPPTWAGKDLLLSLGAIDDFDSTVFDGETVGSTDATVKNFWSAPRLYTVPGRLVTPGRHVIAVRVFDHFGGGGMVGAAELMALTPKEPLTPPVPSFYHPDWRTDFPLGDDPYRYYRW
ncbi:MAG: hypothetical protein A3K19_20615 [Lentisphaerae bacterium RIFOXYB12_FULL_65_16]|nr:MAG: hypothetical protein A3K18_22205 [Lentisphaerae bacterium RIFOXYA12_64_32]OGV89401.1 MAG: hypothetical protein A3K19_20615 [Lentisphaerae bacterium RIFOXYB12_FULL_65_16]